MNRDDVLPSGEPIEVPPCDLPARTEILQPSAFSLQPSAYSLRYSRRGFVQLAAAAAGVASAGAAGSLSGQGQGQGQGQGFAQEPQQKGAQQPKSNADVEKKKASAKPVSEPPSQPSKPTQPLLPNSLSPAIGFQAALAGTGALVESLFRAHGDALLQRQEITPLPWSGQWPLPDEQIAFLPAHRQAALIQSGQLAPSRLVDIYLTRLKRFDPKLLCVVTLMEESARAAAERADAEIKRGDYRGPLHGIPWGLKDLFATKGVPTTWGAKPFEGRVIDEDSEIYLRLQRAGAILVAKLTTGVFAMGDNWFRGKTRNPWNLEQGSSGSSAGPGSATAAGCVSFAIGTETRGSIVSPARRCGISALRPTFGRVSRHGGMTLSWSMDKVGPMARTIEDCALVFNVIHGADEKDASTVTAPFRFNRELQLADLRIGYDSDTDPDFLEKLKALGAEPRQIPDRPNARGVTGILSVESAAAFDDFISKDLDADMVNKWRAKRFRDARKASALDYLNGQRRRFALMREMHEFMEDFDLYVTASGDVGLTNLTGHPAAVLPYKFEKNQPQCITLIGKLFTDDVLLSVAHKYQTATDWHRRQPELA